MAKMTKDQAHAFNIEALEEEERAETGQPPIRHDSKKEGAKLSKSDDPPRPAGKK